MMVALLAVIATCLLIEAAWGVSSANGQALSGAKSGGVFITAGQVGRDAYGIYLVDSENSTICVYQWVPESRELRLLASRNFTFDRQLDDYNTKPTPHEIKDLVEQHRRMGSNPTSRPN